MVSGYQHSCSIMDDGSLYCWGYNAYGQLGAEANTASTPVAVDLPTVGLRPSSQQVTTTPARS